MNSGYYVDSYDYGYGVESAGGLLGGFAAAGAVFLIVPLIISVVMIISMWKVFTKCGKPGWASIVPIYNIYVMCEIVEKPIWYKGNNTWVDATGTPV